MKILKRNEKVKLYLVTLIVLIIGVAIVGILVNDKIQAGAMIPCPNCGTGTMDQTKIVNNSNGTHTLYSVCSSCGFQVEGTTSKCSGTSVCIPYGDSSHRLKTTCSTCGSIKYGAIAECIGGETHSSRGKCSECGQKYITHSEIITSVPYTDTSHRQKITCSACEYVSYGSIAECLGGESHSSGGICTECGQKYLTHTSTLTDYRPIGNGAHKEVYTCSVSGCNWTQEGATRGCNYIYEPIDSITHKGICNDCGYEKTAESHTFENGTCTTCGYKTVGGGDPGGDPPQCEHTYVTKNDETNHWEECSKCGKEKANSKEEHTGATHANDGKCTVCNYQYQTHGQATTVKEYTKTETGHTPVYACTYEGCTETYNGVTENHTLGQYTDNENGTHSVTCTICSYELTAEHTYEEGICSECGAKESSGNETCEHSYVVKSDNTNHWEECSKCGQVKTGTLDVHTYGTYTDNKNGTHSATCSICNYKLTAEHNYENGKCSECNAEKPKEDETCEHNYTVKKDKTKHWEECSKCGEIKTGTLKAHTYGTYTDNKNGTHSATCSKCNYKLTAEHNYQNQTCTECGAEESSENETCEHSYVVKSNKTNHWEECTKCGQVKTGTLEEHTFTNYVDNKDGTHTATCSKCSYKLTEEHQTDGNCQDCSNNSEQKPGEDNNNDNQDDNNNQNNSNNQNNNNQNNNGDKTDNTVVDKDIPYTGIKSVGFIAIFALGVVGIISAVKMKKYKDM